MRFAFPSDYGTRGCALVPIDMALLPIVAGRIAELEERRVWEPADYEQAYRAIADLEACMTTICAQELIESNRQLYRLIDAGFFGRVYVAGASPPETITPAIPSVPNLAFADPGLLGKTEYLSQLVQSKLAGIDTPNFSGTPNVLTLLQSIIDALGSDDVDIAQILTDLELIAALLA